MLAKFRGNVKLAADAVIKTENGKTFMVMNCEGVENRNGQDNVSCYELVYYNEENAKKMQPHLKKGVLINVSGVIAQRKWTDSATGKSIYAYEFIANGIRYVTSEKSKSFPLEFSGLLRITKETQFSKTKNDASVLKIPVAGNRKRKDGTQESAFYELSDWIEKRANALKSFLTVGSRIYAEGSVVQSTWTDKEGRQRSSYNFLLSDLEFAGGGNGNGSQKAGSTSQARPESNAPESDLPDVPVSEEDFSDIPF